MLNALKKAAEALNLSLPRDKRGRMQSPRHPGGKSVVGGFLTER